MTRLFGRRDPDEDRVDLARDAIDSAKRAREEMDNYVQARRLEVAGVRVEQMELRKSINVLEATILADRLRKEADDGA